MASFLSSMYMSIGDEAAAKAVTGDAHQLKLPDTKGSSMKTHAHHAAESVKSNLEHLVQFYQRNSDADKSRQSGTKARRLTDEGEHGNHVGDVHRTGQHPPVSSGFMEGGGEVGFGG